MHLYVDPVFGDDVAGITALDNAIANAQQSLQPGSTVQFPDNVAAPFRTINGQDTMTTQRPLGAIPSLATRSPSPTGYWERFIIHLLPGLYGPGTDCHAPSGRIWNDDVFPIVMHDNISLQGTSALNTVLDARAVGTAPAPPAVVVFQQSWPGQFTTNGIATPSTWPAPPPSFGATFTQTFIDCVTIRGAWQPVGIPDGMGLPAAGVVIQAEDVLLRPTVSNSFIVDNCAGIVILAIALGNNSFTQHEPLIHNCTIARNRVGVVDMDDNGGQQGSGTGHSHAIFLNNLFDNYGTTFQRGEPPNQQQVSLDLIGVDGELLRITQISMNGGQTWQGFPQNGGYVNAFVNARAPLLTESIPVLCWQTPPNPTLFTGLAQGMTRPQLPAASVLEFEPWTYLDPDGRWYLYERFEGIDDWVFNQPVLTRGPGGPLGHDLRSAPAVPHTGAAPAPNPALALSGGFFQNPLIDQGIGSSRIRRRERVYQAGAYVYVTRERVIPSVVVPDAGAGGLGAGGWDTDCEGFCNPRGVVEPRFGQLGAMDTDIGADEIDVLIVGGFQQFTRQVHGARPLPIDMETAVWMFGHRWQAPVVGTWQNAFGGWFPDCAFLPGAVERQPRTLFPSTSPFAPSNAGRWYAVALLLPSNWQPSDWATKPSLAPDATPTFDPARGTPQPDPQWRLDPTSVHVHPSGFVSCSQLVPIGTIPPSPPGNDAAPINWQTGGYTYDSNGVFLWATPLGNTRWAQRVNFTTLPSRNVQTAVARSTPPLQ